MSLKTIITSAGGNKAAGVDKEGFLNVVERPVPPVENPDNYRIFRQFFTPDGTSTGTNDMRVAASSGSPSDFYIPAQPVNDLYIATISFVIADATSTLNKFGNITALTNGCQLFYRASNGDQVFIHNALKSNFNFVRLCQGQPAFGDAAAAFRGSNVSGTSEGYIPSLDCVKTFGIRWGIRLRAGTSQRIVMRIRDDTTGVDQFDAIAYGFQRIPD